MTAQVAMSQLLASFASPTSPNNPTAGQLWYDTGSNVLKVYTGSTWTATSGGGPYGGANGGDTGGGGTGGVVVEW